MGTRYSRRSRATQWYERIMGPLLIALAVMITARWAWGVLQCPPWSCRTVPVGEMRIGE